MRKNRIFSIVLAAIIGCTPMAFQLAGDITLTASAAVVDSGTCGESVKWSLDDEGTLTISGKGAMSNWSWSSIGWNETGDAYINFNSDPTPWFDSRADITRIVVEEGVTEIGALAFINLYKAESVSLPESLTSIGGYSFANCINLKEIAIPDSVAEIGSNSFQYCTAMSSADMSESLKTLGARAFYGCYSLKSMTIPASVESIGLSALELCSALEEVNVSADNKYYSSLGGVLFNKDRSALELYPLGRTAASYTVPSTVETIRESAFMSCKTLRSVTLPSSVKYIKIPRFQAARTLSL